MMIVGTSPPPPATSPATSPAEVWVIEDDPKIAQLLCDYLHADGHHSHHFDDGLAAQQAWDQAQRRPDILILDLMLPGLDGLSLCQHIRQHSDLPILMLTARVDEIDRLLGLDSGADDYVCKPFSPREVMARVRAMLRRTRGHLRPQDPPADPKTITSAPTNTSTNVGQLNTAALAATPRELSATPIWQIDDAGLRIRWRTHWLTLTPVEFRIFRLMLSRPGRVYARAQLLDAAHDPTDLHDVSDRAIDSHIKNLRRKLEQADPGCDCIASVYGVGYRFDVPV